MEEHDYLKRQAKAVYDLSQGCMELGVAGKLRGISGDLDARARELEHRKRLELDSRASWWRSMGRRILRRAH